MKNHTINARIGEDLNAEISEWLKKNKFQDKSSMIQAAIKAYISKPQTLEPVEMVNDSDDCFLSKAREVTVKNKDLLERLK
jgi:Arc/MetJ-type ribon-helix-helix transcriptional regulator